jgi:tRNA 2-selenouridine synthase
MNHADTALRRAGVWGLAALADLREFDSIIDVRSPGEFAHDHIPGAVNWPVLDDVQRAHVGTMYRQESAFAARRLGAALVARAIGQMLAEPYFQNQSAHWNPLVYCWRGGQRSQSLCQVLRHVGWQAWQLQDGYRSYRTAINTFWQDWQWPGRLVVLSGPTGSGKSRLLAALALAGEQVLDLEGLAQHRGSVLGGLPGVQQPSQKLFETRLHWTVTHLDPRRPLFVEAESKRIGQLRLPDPLLDVLRSGEVIHVQMPMSARVTMLGEDYAHLIANQAALAQSIDQLKFMHPRQRVQAWLELAESGQWKVLVEQLLNLHYDPLYARSMRQHFGADVSVRSLTMNGCEKADLIQACDEIRALIKSA